MRFFIRHHSTAEKIINHVENRIIDSLKARKKIVEPTEFLDSLEVHLKNKYELAEILGDVLKDKIPNNLYDIYQKLEKTDKEEIRKHIAKAYFGVLTNFNLQIDSSTKEVDYLPGMQGNETKIKISLPKEFFDKERLWSLLTHSISSVTRVLIELESDAIKFHNSI